MQTAPMVEYSVTITNEPPITAEQWAKYKEWATAKTSKCVASMELGANKRAHIQSCFEAVQSKNYIRMVKTVLGIDLSAKTAVQVKPFTKLQTWNMMAGGYVTKEGGDVWAHNCDLDGDDLVNGKIQYEQAKLRGKELSTSTVLREAVKYAKEHEIKYDSQLCDLKHVICKMCNDDGFSMSHRIYNESFHLLDQEFKMRLSGKRCHADMDMWRM